MSKKQKTLLQNFEWYLPDTGNYWNETAQKAQEIAELGITDVWLPPAYKCASGKSDVGYGVYDMYDLGEFDQKGTIPTKYGTKDEYLNAIKALQNAGIRVYADIVLNHRMGADESEVVLAEEDSQENRNVRISGNYEITAWTKFTFPGRNGKYSEFQWNWTHFDGTDWDDKQKKNSVYLFEGKKWDSKVDDERGNYDYLMGADLDMDNQEVIDELDRWGQWYLETTGVDGFRLDAVKHIRSTFYTHWLTKLRINTGKELPAVAECWNKDVKDLCDYLDASGQVASLFDVPLHFNFHNASKDGNHYDMRNIFQGSLLSTRPDMAVTFVDNHDTQPEQALQSWVEEWFKPLAYAMILLREEGTPCVFYGDLYGIPHNNIKPVEKLPILLKARQKYAWGIETNYLDDSGIIGWTRKGVKEINGSGMAVILSGKAGGYKYMCVGAEHQGETFIDIMGNCKEKIILDETGSALFRTEGGSVSVWVKE